MRQPVLQRQDFVDLLLGLRDDDGDFGVVEHRSELARDRVLIGWHGDAAEAHRRELSKIEPRAVLADDRQLVAAFEAGRGEPQRKPSDLVPITAPIVGLPDAEILLAQRGAPRVLLGIAPQQLRQGCVDRHAARSLAWWALPR